MENLPIDWHSMRRQRQSQEIWQGHSYSIARLNEIHGMAIHLVSLYLLGISFN